MEIAYSEGISHLESGGSHAIVDLIQNVQIDLLTLLVADRSWRCAQLLGGSIVDQVGLSVHLGYRGTFS